MKSLISLCPACLSLLFVFISHMCLAQNASELYEKGEFLKSNSRYQEAIAMFQKSLEMDAKNHLIYYEMAGCYIGLGDFKQAVNSLQQAVKIKVDFNDAYELLGDLYANQFRRPKEAADNYDMAFKHDENPENKLRYKLEIISILYEYDKHYMALQHIRDAEKILPDNFDLQFFEAQYYIETDQFEKAQEIMERLIVDVPEKSGNEMYFFEMGRIYFHLGEYDRAKEFFAKVLEGPYRTRTLVYTPEFLLSVADVYYRVYEYDASESILKQVFDITKGSAPTRAYDLQKELEGVKADKRKLVEAEKSAIAQEKDVDKLAARYSELAKYAFQEGDMVQSDQACQEYVKLKPLDPLTYEIMFLQAMALRKLQRYDDAITLLERMLKNSKIPTAVRAKLNFGLGMVYKSANRLNEADKAFQDAYGGPTKDAARYELTDIFNIKRKQDQQGLDNAEGKEEGLAEE